MKKYKLLKFPKFCSYSCIVFSLNITRFHRGGILNPHGGSRRIQICTDIAKSGPVPRTPIVGTSLRAQFCPISHPLYVSQRYYKDTQLQSNTNPNVVKQSSFLLGSQCYAGINETPSAISLRVSRIQFQLKQRCKHFVSYPQFVCNGRSDFKRLFAYRWMFKEKVFVKRVFFSFIVPTFSFAFVIEIPSIRYLTMRSRRLLFFFSSLFLQHIFFVNNWWVVGLVGRKDFIYGSKGGAIVL